MKVKAISFITAIILLFVTACGSRPPVQTDDSNAENTALEQSVNSSESVSVEDTSLSGSKSRDENLSDPTETDTLSADTPDGFSVIGGTWKVGGIYAKGRLVDIHDHDAIESMYRTTIVTFNEDGSYVYLRTFNERGSWMEKEPGRADCFIMNTESTFMYDLQDGSLVEKETETTRQKQYIVTILDENTFAMNEYDPITGRAKANDDPYLFVKQGTQSAYIADNKTAITKNNSDKTKIVTQKSKEMTSSPVNSDKEPSTSGEKNALEKALQYLEYTAFSYSGLIEQLEFEGFISSEAQYGADQCGADWNEQAARKAKEYLDYSSFSRDGLIDQLLFEGFTQEQAEYGVSQVY